MQHKIVLATKKILIESPSLQTLRVEEPAFAKKVTRAT
jgi:hypothetical protein